MHCLSESAYLELRSVFSEHLSSLPIFRLPKVHAYSHVKQNRLTFLYTCSFNTTVNFYVLAL